MRTPAIALRVFLVACVAVSVATLAACVSNAPNAPVAVTTTPQTPASDATPAPVVAPAIQQGQGQIQRFRVGRLEAIALKDGDIELPNDGKVFGNGHAAPLEVGNLLANAGLARDKIQLSIQPLLVKAGGRVLLFDTGLGNVTWARAGRLPQSLAQAGVAPKEITDIFISHAHPDHIGGLLTPEGALAYPNATIHISAPEWSEWQKDANQTKLTSAIATKVVTFSPGAHVLPEVMAILTPGHTYGHSAFEISSEGEKLLYIGDIAHHYVISLAHPEWKIAWEADAQGAKATRVLILKAVAQKNQRIYAPHFPFPGVGYVQAQGEGFVWAPDKF